MGCLVFLTHSVLGRRSRLSYRTLSSVGVYDGRVKVVVGKERKEFLVDPVVLEEVPFRVLIDLVRKNDKKEGAVDDIARRDKEVVFVDVDVILFEHMLWLMHNDYPSLFQLNLKELVDFYAQDL
ncbi:auxin-responsive protein SAUR77 [Heracleum sosnowskyi]|uniref:Auxin-responsive protein SAUR77 n=1 Tax=Heracleum sosnowskyi TaxID=360622 RepID=A0AAD8HEA3_9APIA|nr:auxin-responsive protein SAUR77 [Heracleum sosnowskyi]